MKKAPEILGVRITDEYIEKGVRKNSTACPLALALLDCPDVKNATVGNTAAFIRFRQTWWEKIFYAEPSGYYRMSDLGKYFVKEFDAGRPFHPGSVDFILYR